LLIALLSDIHSNAEALTACLQDANERGADRFAFLGDFVGYGGDPKAVVEQVAAHAARGAIVVRGNHDDAVEKPAGYFNEAAQAAIELARRVLSPEQRRFLSELPLIAREDTCCFVHSSAASPERWNYVDSPTAARRSIDAAQTAYTFCGHVHEQCLYFQTAPGKVGTFQPDPGTPIPVHHNRRWLAIVGSVGQPRDLNPAAAYAMFDAGREQITFYRVPYDSHAAAEKIRNSGLPESLAYRVERGI
jgi:diadenosine tetraphosphatase ApaH/serine/threonine PP2A family protein phosphatase